MYSEPVLVAGASGGKMFQQGAIGRHLTRLLIDRGVPVRAMVHSEDERAEALRELGAEVVLGELTEIESVAALMKGVRRAFFTYPMQPGLLDAAGVFAAAAKMHDVEQVVNVSMVHPEPEGGTPRSRQHWTAEQVFDWAGVGAFHLRASLFCENIISQLTGEPGSRRLPLPLGGGDAYIPLVAAGDVARVAVAVLAADSPAAQGNSTLVGELASIRGIVADYEEVYGEPLQYQDVTPEQWREATLRRGSVPHRVNHLSALWQLLALLGPQTVLLDFFQPTGEVERLTGRPALSFREFLLQWREENERPF
jgi:uncharacterized protein YbjT (DUF2867 family)